MPKPGGKVVRFICEEKERIPIGDGSVGVVGIHVE